MGQPSPEAAHVVTHSRSKVCPQGKVTGSLRMSKQIEHVKSMTSVEDSMSAVGGGAGAGTAGEASGAGSL